MLSTPRHFLHLVDLVPWVLRILHWMSSRLLKGQTMPCLELVPVPPESPENLPDNLPVTQYLHNICCTLAFSSELGLLTNLTTREFCGLGCFHGTSNEIPVERFTYKLASARGILKATCVYVVGHVSKM